jgi:hypothetical protein
VPFAVRNFRAAGELLDQPQGASPRFEPGTPLQPGASALRLMDTARKLRTANGTRFRLDPIPLVGMVNQMEG